MRSSSDSTDLLVGLFGLTKQRLEFHALQDLIGWASDSAYACMRARNRARNEGRKPRNIKYALAHPFVAMIGFDDGDVIKVRCAQQASLVGQFNPEGSPIFCAHDQMIENLHFAPQTNGSTPKSDEDSWSLSPLLYTHMQNLEFSQKRPCLRCTVFSITAAQSLAMICTRSDPTGSPDDLVFPSSECDSSACD